MAAHSPLPWTIQGVGEDLVMDDAAGCPLMGATTYYPWVPEKDEDWHFIVRCVNSHDDLLAALKAAHHFIHNGIELGFIRMPDAESHDPALRTPDLVRAAIARAEAK